MTVLGRRGAGALGGQRGAREDGGGRKGARRPWREENEWPGALGGARELGWTTRGSTEDRGPHDKPQPGEPTTTPGDDERRA
jgi:hypothetical protein